MDAVPLLRKRHHRKARGGFANCTAAAVGAKKAHIERVVDRGDDQDTNGRRKPGRPCEERQHVEEPCVEPAESGPGADVAGVSLVSVQMWQREPSPGQDVAGTSLVSMQMWQG